jgi:hypothetical protein
MQIVNWFQIISAVWRLYIQKETIYDYVLNVCYLTMCVCYVVLIN